MFGLGLGLGFAQSAGSFSPTQLSGLDIYLKDGSTYNATSGVWTDSSGNGHDFTFVTNKPAAGTINSAAAVTFNGTDDQRLSGAHGLTTAGEVFFVTKTGGGASYGLHRMQDPGALGSYYPFLGSIYESFGSTTRRDAIGLPVTLSAAHVYNVRSAAGLYEVAFDGAAPFYTSASNTFGIVTTLLLGYNQDAALYGGEIGSVIIYNRVLTAPERAQVMTFLRDKWGTP